MTDVELNQQQIKFCDFPQIRLDDIDERCGEVFITLSGALIFHCSLCANNYGSVDNYLDHLASQHYKDVQEEGETEELENDAKSESETLFNHRTDNLYQEQKLMNNDVDDDDGDGDVDIKVDVEDCVVDDVNDNDIDEYEEMLHSEQVANLESITSEDNVEAKELDAENIKFKTEIKEQTLGTQHLQERKPRTKSERQYRIKEKEFICKQCGKEFKSNLQLKRHSTIHSDERRHKCDHCDFAFKDRANLDSHVRRHLGINKIACGFCPKTFFTHTEARNHRRTHTGEKPYVCSICNRAFTAPNRLKMHMKRHTSEPTFKCDYCEKGFYERGRFQDHVLVHTKEKHFVCEICAATFARHKSWVRHAKMHESSIK